MKTSLLTEKVLGIDNRSFLNNLSGFSPCWDHKNNNEIISQKNTDSNTIDNIYLKADCFDGIVVNGIKKPLLYNLVLYKAPGYKIICSPETIHY